MEGNCSDPTTGTIPVFTWRDDKNHGKPKSKESVSGSKFETAMFRIRGRNATHSAMTFVTVSLILPIWLTAGP
jgi:hypothetical protein